MSNGLGSSFREHDNEIAVTEVAECMGEADVGSRCLHREVRSDHTQSVIVGKPAEQGRQRSLAGLEGGTIEHDIVQSSHRRTVCGHL
ncbi:MAG: hypothetical protein WKF64_07570 [Ilumatobacteraceae bacterium]